jgi:hypothetical protein
MKRPALWLIAFVLACGAGIVCGRARTLRSGLATCPRRTADASNETLVSGGVSSDSEHDRQSGERLLLESIVSAQMAQSLGADEEISAAEVTREVDLLRWQFPDERSWRAALWRRHLRVPRLTSGLCGR